MDQIQLRSYATVRQLEILDAIEEHGSNRAAARALGVNESAVRASLAALHRKVAMNEVKPPMITGAAGPGVTSSSTLYGADGAPKLQWVKTEASKGHQLELIKEVAAAMVNERYQLDYSESALESRGEICLDHDLEVLVYTWSAQLKRFDYQLDEVDRQHI